MSLQSLVVTPGPGKGGWYRPECPGPRILVIYWYIIVLQCPWPTIDIFSDRNINMQNICLVRNVRRVKIIWNKCENNMKTLWNIWFHSIFTWFSHYCHIIFTYLFTSISHYFHIIFTLLFIYDFTLFSQFQLITFLVFCVVSIFTTGAQTY